MAKQLPRFRMVRNMGDGYAPSYDVTTRNGTVVASIRRSEFDGSWFVQGQGPMERHCRAVNVSYRSRAAAWADVTRFLVIVEREARELLAAIGDAA